MTRQTHEPAQPVNSPKPLKGSFYAAVLRLRPSAAKPPMPDSISQSAAGRGTVVGTLNETLMVSSEENVAPLVMPTS